MSNRPRLCYCRPNGGYCAPDCNEGTPELPELELVHGDPPPGVRVITCNGTRYLCNGGTPREEPSPSTGRAFKLWRDRADYDPALDPYPYRPMPDDKAA